MEQLAASFYGSFLSWDSVSQFVWAILPVWLFGAVTGYLMPRPRWASFNLSYFILTGTNVRSAILAWQGLLIIRELWYKITDPGTFRHFCKAVALFACGQGWHFDFPSAYKPGVPTACDANASFNDNWYVTEKDLGFFQYHAEGTGATQGAGPWEIMMEKTIPNVMTYIAWRRVLPNGKTEYKSNTICADATAEEFIDLYFDDSFRPNWDTMIIAHQVGEHGDFSQRQQVVRWTRRFPFSFISDRQYTIARRMFKLGGDLYGVTKAVDHPSASMDTQVVSVDEFYSMWRSRTVKCPWGSDRPAVETLLLHHEQFKIPENLARFAVRHGMWPFVKKLSQMMPQFVAERRARGVTPHAYDSQAFGAGFVPNPPQDGYGSSLSSVGSSDSSENSSECDMPQQRSRRQPQQENSASTARKIRGFAAFAIASSIALLVRRKTSDCPRSRAGGRDIGARLGRSASMASGLSKRRRYQFVAEPFTE